MVSNPTNMDAKEFVDYLAEHNITKYEIKRNYRGETEVNFPCPFMECDEDRRSHGEELHCSFNLNKCVYHCFKCDTRGNYLTLRKFMGDFDEWVEEQKEKGLEMTEEKNDDKQAEKPKPKTKKKQKLSDIAIKCHRELPDEWREYFHRRGLNDESINKYLLGYGEFKGKKWLTIPISDKNGEIVYFQLRRLPNEEDVPGGKYNIYPGAELIMCGEDQFIDNKSSDVLVCEGQFDRIITLQNGIGMPVVTAGGAQVFKDEWFTHLRNARNVYVCMDVDETGMRAAESLTRRLEENLPNASIYNIELPYPVGSKADLTDYFVDKKGTAKELVTTYAHYCGGAKPIDPSSFEEMGVEDIANVLDLTIKHDNENKVITFLAMLLAYTESDQLNVMFNAASSTGKTYISTEVSKLFPAQDVLVYGRTSPTAFYYNEALTKMDQETGETYIDLERRIVVFTEQPDTMLLANLRAFLSHDSKHTKFTLTNKGKNGKNTAVDHYILGFSSVFFCTANMRIDEQEQTRCLILSPESSKAKIEKGIEASIDRSSDRKAYAARLESNEARKSLMDRIQYIKALNIGEIKIQDSNYLKRRFMDGCISLRARNQRDVSHFISLVKGMALLNAPFRMVDGVVVATNKDVDEAMKLWNVLNESMFYGVSPHVLDYYKNYILEICRELYESRGIPRSAWSITADQFANGYFKLAGSYPNMDNFRKMFIPALQGASLISYEKDDNDKRQKLIKPLVFFDD